MASLTLLPSYGIDYKSKQEVMFAWGEGKDFTLARTGQQTSIRDINDLKTGGYTSISFSYYNKTKQLLVDL